MASTVRLLALAPVVVDDVNDDVVDDVPHKLSVLVHCSQLQHHHFPMFLNLGNFDAVAAKVVDVSIDVDYFQDHMLTGTCYQSLWATT